MEMTTCTIGTFGCGEFFFLISGVLGTILLAYSQFIEAEYRRDLVRIMGALGLFVYAMFIGNVIFMIAMGAVAFAALVEFIEIYIGVHKHLPEDLKTHIKKHKGVKK